MLQKISYSIIFFNLFSFASAQKSSSDTSGKVLDEVVITGTRTENTISNLPLPIQVITSKTISLSGSEKLIDILQMQSSLVIANNPLGTALQGYPNPFGNGIQMQGLDPAYTLILIDGEPLTGRNAGIINLGRIALGNIKQIEILKGPATSLYGSDALAGVINIISKEPKKNSLDFQTHYASNNTLGLTGASSIKYNNTSFQLFANRYSGNGYDLDKNIYGKTVDPFIDYSFSAKMLYDINAKNKLMVSARYFSEKQINNYLIYPLSDPEVVKGNTIETDKSAYARLQHTVNNKLNYSTSVYATSYSNNAAVYLQKNDSLYETIMLTQFLFRPEIQVNAGKNPAALFVTGLGYNFETVNSSRYSSLKELNSWYAFVQKQIQWKEKINILAGARFDKNSLYAAQLSPKIAVGYKVSPNFIIKGSVGAGFKAPDFRQQFLNFSNTLIGYTLLGARELGDGLGKLKRNGEIDDAIDISPYANGVELSPEKSIGINVGFDYTLHNNSVLKINFFRNDISNLIETYNLPFKKINNQAIYSYENLNKVFTEGAEVNISHNISRNISVYGSYQYLLAKDKDVLHKIKNGEIYKRDPITNITSPVTKKEYKGLYNRSRNTANIRLQYDNVFYKATAFVTAKYRGRYGFDGLNNFEDGSGILDDDREFVKGFLLVNTTFSKRLGTSWEIQSGVENILNYTNRLQMPNIFGRTYFINVNFKLDNKDK
ncbi:MAG: TonB-dependent receptor [Ginsengibacter sp.]